jgi:hypothetical protein
MNPWKSFTGLASWVMRIAITLVIFAHFFNAFMGFNFQTLGFIIAAVFIVFGVLIFVGGFLSKHTLTVLSALVLLFLSALQAYWAFNGVTSTFSFWLLMCAASLYFLSNGNKK